MDYILDIIALIGFIALFIFFALWPLALYNRNSVKKALKEYGYKNYDEIFAKSILHESISKAKKEELFFKKKEWPDIESPKIKRLLVKQRLIKSISIRSFIGFITCYVLAMVLSAIFNR